MAYNVLVIVCDTLRADILSLYGGAAKTPFLNSFSRSAMVYNNCIAPSPWTYPSHVSLFTGLYSSEHGVHETEKVKLLDITDFHKELKTDSIVESHFFCTGKFTGNINSAQMKGERIAEYLSRRGYNTYGISNNIMVSPYTYFDKGFDSFFSLDAEPKTNIHNLVSEAKKFGSGMGDIIKVLLKRGQLKDIIKYAGAWMKIKSINKAMNYPIEKGSILTNNLISNGKLEAPFFSFINLFEMHEPYDGYDPKETWENFTGVKRITSKKASFLKRQYVKEAEYLDLALERLIKTMKKKGVYDDTMIIITSDHGQAFNEHNYMFHNTYLYDELIRIPMIIKYPKNKKFEKRPGYQSLVNVPKLIHETVEGGDDSALTKESAFSEAYGSVTILPNIYRDRKKYVKQKYEKMRKAVYRDGFKLVVNGTDGIIEEFTKDGKDADPQRFGQKLKELTEELDIFKGSEKFKTPPV